MAETWLRYDRMVEDALRSVVRKALIEAAQRGLPGEHHFYITFHTERPGVGIADWLRQQYPQEMTIILQHQFWDLTVEEERFAVTLSFGGRHERLTVPLEAVTASPILRSSSGSSSRPPMTRTRRLTASPAPR